MSDAIIQCHDLKKTYHDGNLPIHVLQGVHFLVNPGDRIAIIGPSGSGKSTLLHLLGGLDNATSGQILIQGVNWQHLSEKRRCYLRNQKLGFVYQFHHLLPEFSALENVAMPLLLGDHTIAQAQEHAHHILVKVGLEARIHHKPSQLSGGERQRVAIARALVHQPACVFADEPTGNLDQKTAWSIFELMLDLNKQLNTSLVIVTHDTELAKRMDKTFYLQKGILSEIT